MSATWLWALTLIVGGASAGPVDSEDKAEHLKTYRQIRKQFSEGGDVERSRLVRWCGDRQLWREMFEEGDKVLTADPSHEETRRFLSDVAATAELESDRPTARPEARVRAFLKIIRDARSPARAVVAEAKIETIPGVDRRDPLIKALSDRSEVVRVVAIRALGRIGGEDARYPLVRVQLADPADEVRSAAFEAVQSLQQQDPDFVVPYLSALQSSLPQVRARAAEALGALNVPAAVPAIIKTFAQSSSSRPPRSSIFVGQQESLVTDFDPEIAQAAVIADPIVTPITTGVVLDVAILGVERRVTVEELVVYRRVLPRLSGASVGDRASDWVSWWNGGGHLEVAAKILEQQRERKAQQDRD